MSNPKVIITAEELDALPVGSIINGRWLAEKWAEPEGEVWHVAGKGQPWDHDKMLRMMALPAVVLSEPTA